MKCPICEYEGEFKPYGINPRPNAQCPNCGSLERHRAVWLYIRAKLWKKLLENKHRLLHFAPEHCIRTRLSKTLLGEYIPSKFSDPESPNYHDITNINLPDKSIDAILCSHVLEHIKHDDKALLELNRIMSDEGWAIILVPIIDNLKETIEGSDQMTSDEKLLLFGHPDHMRSYGKDFTKKLKKAGFKWDPKPFRTIAKAYGMDESDLVKRFGLKVEPFYFCQKIKSKSKRKSKSK